MKRLLALLISLFTRVPAQPMLASVVLLLVRLALAAFMINHGLGKVDLGSMTLDGKFLGGVEKMGLPMPVVFAWAAVASELAAAAMVGLGLFTRPAALMVMTTMAVAAFGAHGPDPLFAGDGRSKEPALIFLLNYLLIFATGPGMFSIDRFFGKRVSKRVATAKPKPAKS